MTLTKTLQFDEKILHILRDLSWSADGQSATIVQPLDRPTYEKVNRALETMGGKWNRGLRAHLFKSDPRPQVDGLLETGVLTVERDGFFETPEPVVERMLGRIDLSDYMDVLEPSAGLGAIARVLKRRLPTVRLMLVEKNTERFKSLCNEFPDANVQHGDFMQFITGYGFDLVIMNPPFEEGQDIQHVQHAYTFVKSGGKLIAIMAEGVFFRSDRKAAEFRVWLDDVGGYSECLPEGSFKASGTGVNTRLVVIRK